MKRSGPLSTEDRELYFAGPGPAIQFAKERAKQYRVRERALGRKPPRRSIYVNYERLEPPGQRYYLGSARKPNRIARIDSKGRVHELEGGHGIAYYQNGNGED